MEGEQQATVAVGLLGAEGVVGVSGVLNSRPEHLKFEVQTAGRAWCAPSSALRRLIDTRPPILWFISKYLWQLVEHIAQVSAEIQTHDIRRRLACWLLLSAHKAQTQTLHLTHEWMSHLLGVRREAVSLAAAKLMKQGLIRYSRGHIHILDRQGLEERACECYGVVQKQYQNLLNWPVEHAPVAFESNAEIQTDTI